MTSLVKESWEPGDTAFFEYRCWESPKSADANLWYHSHQQVEILEEVESDAWEGSTIWERLEAGHPKAYNIRFPDGFVGCATEDELMTDPEGYCRPDPPTRENEP